MQLGAVERAQAQLTLAHSIHALLRLYLLASGADPATHGPASEAQVP